MTKRKHIFLFHISDHGGVGPHSPPSTPLDEENHDELDTSTHAVEEAVVDEEEEVMEEETQFVEEHVGCSLMKTTCFVISFNFVGL